jgi:hypothetical protein
MTTYVVRIDNSSRDFQGIAIGIAVSRFQWAIIMGSKTVMPTGMILE